ncbi:hypothetical protein AB4Z34_08810 [Ensifer sp. 2YAB10]|uniref:hypothetical protein n=1 Tax=unclassified Ensifer TaxID=2633371 RepID=UPI003F8EB296
MAGGTHNFVLGRSEATRERFPLGLLRLMFQAFPNAKPLRTFAETALNALAHNPKIEIDFGIMR